VNEPGDMQRLAGWGVDRIITDRPDVCLQVLHEMGKRVTAPASSRAGRQRDAYEEQLASVGYIR